MLTSVQLSRLITESKVSLTSESCVCACVCVHLFGLQQELEENFNQTKKLLQSEE